MPGNKPTIGLKVLPITPGPEKVPPLGVLAKVAGKLLVQRKNGGFSPLTVNEHWAYSGCVSVAKTRIIRDKKDFFMANPNE